MERIGGCYREMRKAFLHSFPPLISPGKLLPFAEISTKYLQSACRFIGLSMLDIGSKRTVW